ncbi:hypothetical protein MRB53_036892 [Persea americana]|nr:hypothetical protein MRB53_036892 [Persea americana]
MLVSIRCQYVSSTRRFIGNLRIWKSRKCSQIAFCVHCEHGRRWLERSDFGLRALRFGICSCVVVLSSLLRYLERKRIDVAKLVSAENVLSGRTHGQSARSLGQHPGE